MDPYPRWFTRLSNAAALVAFLLACICLFLVASGLLDLADR